MTIITYGKSVSENAKTRRHARRRAVAMERERIESIIDAAFGVEPEVIQADKKSHVSRVSKAVCSPSLRSKHESTSVCLPEVAQFAAGYRKPTESITAR